MTLRRYDSAGQIQRFEPIPGGGIRVEAFVTRVGVFRYRLEDGRIRKELRPPEEVFSPESMATLVDAPVTDLHPPGPVTPDTYKAVNVGHVSSPVEQVEDYVRAYIVVGDGSTISLIDSGERKETSCGYTAECDETPGVWDGEPYDAIQRTIRYNHVALGQKGWGRGGPEVALRLDGGENLMIVKVDGKEYEKGSDGHLAALEAREARITAERDQASGRADGLATQLQARPDETAVRSQARERGKLIAQARSVLGADYKKDAEEEMAADDLSIMIDMIKRFDPDFKEAGKSRDFILGMLSAFMSQNAPSTPAPTEPEVPSQDTSGALSRQMGGEISDSVSQVRAGTVPEDPKKPKPNEAKSRADMVDRHKAAWEKPLAMHKEG